jgi:hypothetical protein
MKALASNVAAVSSELKTFSTQVSSTTATPKLMLSDPLEDSIAPMMPLDRPRDSGPIAIPALLPQLDREDYKNTEKWESTGYKGQRKVKKQGGEGLPMDKNAPSVLSSFMEDENGNPIPKDTQMAVRSTAHAFYLVLLENGRAPATWGAAPLGIRNQLINILETQFPFLRFCKDHWKAIQVGSNTYSQWHKKAVRCDAASKAKKASRKAKGEAAEVEVISDVETTGDNEKGSKRPGDDLDDVPGPSKRRHIEDPQPTSTSRPLPTRITPQGQKVRMYIYTDYLNH